MSFIPNLCKMGKHEEKEVEKISIIHAGGQSPYEDAKEAIEYLHSIVEETVSVFRHYEIQQGKLVPKDQNGAFWR